MSRPPSAAERLDQAVDGLLDGLSPAMAAATAGIGSAGGVLVGIAGEVRRALAAPPVASRFEARLGTRLAEVAIPPRDPVAWARRHPGRLIVTGAVGSAVGVGVTAYAVWRTTRRAGSAHRLHR